MFQSAESTLVTKRVRRSQLVSIVEMESEGVMVISDLSGFLEIM